MKRIPMTIVGMAAGILLGGNLTLLLGHNPAYDATWIKVVIFACILIVIINLDKRVNSSRRRTLTHYNSNEDD